MVRFLEPDPSKRRAGLFQERIKQQALAWGPLGTVEVERITREEGFK